FFFSSRRRHTRFSRDWSSDVCSSDLPATEENALLDRFADSDDSDELAFRLQRLIKDSGLAQVILLSIHGTVIADKDFRFTVGEQIGRASCREEVEMTEVESTCRKKKS